MSTMLEHSGFVQNVDQWYRPPEISDHYLLLFFLFIFTSRTYVKEHKLFARHPNNAAQERRKRRRRGCPQNCSSTTHTHSFRLSSLVHLGLVRREHYEARPPQKKPTIAVDRQHANRHTRWCFATAARIASLNAGTRTGCPMPASSTVWNGFFVAYSAYKA